MQATIWIKKNLEESPFLVWLLKVTAFYILWYIIYERILLSDGRLDHWLSVNVTSVAAGLVGLFTDNFWATDRIFAIGDGNGIFIVDGCNGLTSMGLFLGFLFAYPGRVSSRLTYAFIGLCLLYVVNVIRVIALALIQVYWAEAFDFAHSYSTSAIFYTLIFGLWVVWANYGVEE